MVDPLGKATFIRTSIKPETSGQAPRWSGVCGSFATGSGKGVFGVALPERIMVADVFKGVRIR
jgi:hypothetical protein